METCPSPRVSCAWLKPSRIMLSPSWSTTSKRFGRGQMGTLVDGMGDVKSEFYLSNLYRGFYLENLPGFDLVFKSKGGEVKIFKMKDSLFTGNKEGKIDPIAIARVS